MKDRAPWPPPGSASPLQKRGNSRTWYTPDTRDFIRLLRWRAQAGAIYAIIGDHDRADILVRSMDAKPERWVRAYTYPKIGLRAMHEAGLLSMAEVMAIPDFDPAALEVSEADRRRFGELPEFWKVEVPDDGTPVRYPNKRPYRGQR